VKDVMLIKKVVLYVRLGFLAPTFQGISFERRYYMGKFIGPQESRPIKSEVREVRPPHIVIFMAPDCFGHAHAPV
jgi:hypothetical protein